MGFTKFQHTEGLGVGKMQGGEKEKRQKYLSWVTAEGVTIEYQ